MGIRQAVRHMTLTHGYTGSNPVCPVRLKGKRKNKRKECTYNGLFTSYGK